MVKTFLIFFGPPGSGKGTQAYEISEKMGLMHLSTGALLREEVRKKTNLGMIAEPIMKRGELISDDLILKMIEENLAMDKAAKGAVFDGYPRNYGQQEHLLTLIEQLDIDGEKDRVLAILINVSDKEVGKRVTSRRSCLCGEVYHLIFNPPKEENICDKCGDKLYAREDDNKDVLETRLLVYHNEVQPLLDFWREKGKLVIVNGEQSPKKVLDDLIKEIKKYNLL